MSPGNVFFFHLANPSNIYAALRMKISKISFKLVKLFFPNIGRFEMSSLHYGFMNLTSGLA